MMILTSDLAPEILEAVQSDVFSVWFLIGAALVFFMQCGFAMVEAGFTRAKNTANIIMKNLIDFCLGTVAFFLLGYNLLCGEGNKFIGFGLNPFGAIKNVMIVNNIPSLYHHDWEPYKSY